MEERITARLRLDAVARAAATQGIAATEPVIILCDPAHSPLVTDQNPAKCHFGLIAGSMQRAGPGDVCGSEHRIRISFEYEDDGVRIGALSEIPDHGAEREVGRGRRDLRWFIERNHERQLHLVLVKEQQPQPSLDGATEKVGHAFLDEGVSVQRDELRFVISCWCHPPIIDRPRSTQRAEKRKSELLLRERSGEERSAHRANSALPIRPARITLKRRKAADALAVDLDILHEHVEGAHPHPAHPVERAIDDERLLRLGVLGHTDHLVEVSLVVAIQAGCDVVSAGHETILLAGGDSG